MHAGVPHLHEQEDHAVRIFVKDVFGARTAKSTTRSASPSRDGGGLFIMSEVTLYYSPHHTDAVLTPHCYPIKLSITLSNMSSPYPTKPQSLTKKRTARSVSPSRDAYTLPRRIVKRFRGGLVFKAHRLFVSLNSRLESNEEEERVGGGVAGS